MLFVVRIRRPSTLFIATRNVMFVILLLLRGYVLGLMFSNSCFSVVESRSLNGSSG